MATSTMRRMVTICKYSANHQFKDKIAQGNTPDSIHDRASPVDLATPTMSRTPRGDQIRIGKPTSATCNHFRIIKIYDDIRSGRYRSLSPIRLLGDRIWRMTMAVTPPRPGPLILQDPSLTSGFRTTSRIHKE